MFSIFISLQNLDLLTIGIAIASIGILGFIVYSSNKNSVTNQSFLIFSFFTIVYGVLNYISYHISSPFLTLWALRFTIFAAVWHAFSFYRLFTVFPQEQIVFDFKYKKIILPLVIVCSLINLTPLSMQKIVMLGGSGEASQAQTGPGMALFGLLVAYLIISSIVSIVKNTLHSEGQKRDQYKFILIGTIITFSLLLCFNLLLPVVFNIVIFISLAPLFILPFVAFTSYAIMRYHLLDVKIIATEVLIFALSIGTLLEILLSETVTAAVIRFLIFLLILSLGILLDKSVRREVNQRVQLQKLTQELSQANDKLTALDKARAEFISIASHQLRTPPATLKWYLSAILAGDYGNVPESVSSPLKKAEQTNNLLISLIEDMLNVSRIERGTMEFLFEPVNVEELAKTTYEQLVPMASDKQLIFKYNPPAKPLPNIMADKEKLRQVINNLIDNAIKYTPHGSVTLSLSQDKGKVMFSVTDTGKGIAKGETKNIFQKYTRGKDSIMHSAGLGLGLYVAKIIVEQHKGKLWAESEGEGKGSTFIVSIPIKNNLKATSQIDLTKK